MSTPLPEVRVAWRPEQFNRVTNPGFETNTTGWSVSAGINAAATSITRVTTDSHSGSASATVVCTSTDGSGVNFDMGSETWYSEPSYGAIYVAVVWLKRVSGSTRVKVILGSEGTAEDRATLSITDLPDAWTPYVVRWLPVASRTDVQLAVTNGSAEAITFRIDDAAVYLLDGFTQVENGSFEVDTTGWVTFSSASVARSTSEAFAGSACLRITSSTTANSGARFGMIGRTFLDGRTYRVRFAAKVISGSGDWTVGFLDSGSTQASADFSPTSSWAVYTLDWTASGDKTDVRAFIRHIDTSVAVLAVDEVEVYEAVDDLGTDAGDLTWTRSLDAIGTATVTVDNPDGDYDPRYASSPLYGSVAPGKRLMIRAVDGETLRGCFYGTIATIEPRPWDGVVDLVAEDMMGVLRDADVFVDFAQNDSYRWVRQVALDGAVSGIPASTESLDTSAHETLAYGIEGNTFYRGTDGNVPALDLLADLNEATQTVHFCRPSPHAMIGWKYETVDRATLTDTSSDATVDESDPPQDLTGVRYTHENLVNRSEVAWQGYEKLPPPGADSDGFGFVVKGYDPTVYGDLELGDDAPYIAYTDEAYGTDEDHPEPRWRYPKGMTAKQWRERRRRGLKVKRRRRVYPRAVLPFRMAAGEVRRFVFDFSVPISGPVFDWDSTVDWTRFDATLIEQRPNRLIVDLRCITADTIDYIIVAGTPWLPLDDLTETTNAYDSQLASGVRAESASSTPYVPSRAAAQGVGAYRTWRYSEARMAPTIVDRNNRYTLDLTDHLTVTLDRWRLSSVLFLVTGCTWSVTQGGLDWTISRDLEELPAHTDWFVLDDTDAGLDDAVVLAY